MEKKTVLSRLHQPVHPFIFIPAITGAVAIFLLILVMMRPSYQQTYQSPRVNVVSSPTATPSPNQSISVTPDIKGYTYFDFDKILSEDFLTYTNDEIGFSIKYPAESRKQVFTASEEQSPFRGNPNFPHPLGAIGFYMIADPPGADEWVNGLSIDFYYYKTTPNFNLETAIKWVQKENCAASGQIISGGNIIVPVTFDNIQGYKVMCGNPGAIYLFPAQQNNYFIEIDDNPSGFQHDKFKLVADKMMSSLKFHFDSN